MTRPKTTRELADITGHDVKSTARQMKKYAAITGVVFEHDGKRKLVAPADAAIILRAVQLTTDHSSVSFDMAVEQAIVEAKSQRPPQKPDDVLRSILAAQHALTALTVGLRSRLPQRSDFDSVELLLIRFQNRLTSALDAVQTPLEEGSGTVGVQELALTLSELGHLTSRICAVGALLDGQMAYWQRRDDRAFKVFTGFVQAWQQLDDPSVGASVDVVVPDTVQLDELSSPQADPEPHFTTVVEAPDLPPISQVAEPAFTPWPNEDIRPIPDLAPPVLQEPAPVRGSFFKQSFAQVVQSADVTPAHVESHGTESGRPDDETDETYESEGEWERLTTAPDEYARRYGLPEPTEDS